MAVSVRSTTARIGQARQDCPICLSPDLEYEFIIDGYPACSCRRCNLLFLNPQPETGHTDARADDVSARLNGRVHEVYTANALMILAKLVEYAGSKPGRLLLVNATAEVESEARRCGFNVTAVPLRALESESLADFDPGSIDACILYRALERASDPVKVLEAVRQLLIAGGALMVISPTLDSRTARLFRSRWWEFKKENRYYFSADTLQNILLRSGYGDPVILRDDAVISLQYARERLAAMPPALRYRILRLALAMSPAFLRYRAFRFLHSRIVVMVRPKPVRSAPQLSVIVPVYNERATFDPMMQRLINKTIEGLNIEIIIVESNSRDGTREQVLQYETHPQVRIVLEERARGKGHAVRAGLKVASGDVILFQDADLEYDIDDYDSLLEPLLRYERNFVIGSRHILKGRVWKMRQFNNAAGLAAVFNLGHLAFLALFNFIYRQSLKDPFSMFKVFRRECLFGLDFECDRFDFDFEITIKLLRKGYRALELPVNYRARSFSEGKKVTLVRDPITWLRALLKFRFSPLYLKSRE